MHIANKQLFTCRLTTQWINVDGANRIKFNNILDVLCAKCYESKWCILGDTKKKKTIAKRKTYNVYLLLNFPIPSMVFLFWILIPFILCCSIYKILFFIFIFRLHRRLFDIRQCERQKHEMEIEQIKTNEMNPNG